MDWRTTGECFRRRMWNTSQFWKQHSKLSQTWGNDFNAKAKAWGFRSRRNRKYQLNGAKDSKSVKVNCTWSRNVHSTKKFWMLHYPWCQKGTRFSSPFWQPAKIRYIMIYFYYLNLYVVIFDIGFPKYIVNFGHFAYLYIILMVGTSFNECIEMTASYVTR